MRVKTSALEEAQYLIGKGFSKADIQGFASWVDGAFSGIKGNLTSRINNANGFSLIHSNEELKIILLRGKSLNLPDNEIDDLLFVSCRDSKPINAVKLRQQIDNWVNVVQARGYPYKFNSIQEFNDFGAVLNNVAANFNLTPNKFYIQGSTLRNGNLSEIGDIDVAFLVNQNEFDNLVQHFIDMSVSPTNISKLQADAPKGIIRDINMRMNQSTPGTFRGHFYDAFENSSFQTTPMNYFGIEKVNISVVKVSGTFDVSPYLKIN